jgi:glycosyltransferase involved in cell wall biosynthesis
MSRVRSRRRILLCTWGYAPYVPGGAERQAQLQAEELVRRGYEVSVVCPRFAGTHSGVVNGVPVSRLPFFQRRPFRKLTYGASLFFFLLRRMWRLDLVMVHLAVSIASVAVFVSGITRCPVWVRVAAMGPGGDVARMRRSALVTRYLGLRRAARVQATSTAMAVELLGIGVSTDRLIVAPNGVDLRGFGPAGSKGRAAIRRRLQLPLNKVLVLFAGRLTGVKGVPDLLETWRAFDTSTASLVLVGSRGDPGTVDLDGVEGPGVLVHPWSASVVDYYRAADVYVLPSRAEGMSNALLEAMACGLPVVATRVGAAEVMIEDGVSGMLVTPGDTQELAGALRTLIADPALRERMGAEARRTVEERYAIARVVDRILDSGHALMNGHR